VRKVLPLLILVLLHGALFWKYYVGIELPIHRDLVYQHIPMKVEAGRQWAAGHLPAWDPNTLNGQPLLANPNYASFYPSTFLMGYGKPVPRACGVLLFHHLFLLLGWYVLARRLQLTNPVIVLTGTIVGFAGPTLSSMAYFNMLAAISWIPWHLASWTVKQRSWRITLAAVTLALIVLAGFPFAVPAALFLAFFFLILRGDYRWKTRLADLAMAGILAAGLGAIQIVPAAAMVGDTLKAEAIPYSESLGYFSFYPIRTLEFVFPAIFGDPNGELSSQYWGSSFADSGNPLIASPYIGIVTIILLIFFLKKRRAWVLGALGVILILSWGRFAGLHWLLTTLIPPLGGFRFPEKYLLLLPFVAALGIMVQPDFSNFTRKVRYLFVGLASILTGVGLFGVGMVSRIFSVSDPVYASGILRIQFLVSAILLAFLAMERKRAGGEHKRSWFLAGLIVSDLLSFHAGVMPGAESNMVSSPPPLVKVLKEENAGRIFHLLASEFQLDEENQLQVDSFYRGFDRFAWVALFPRSGTLFNLSYALDPPIDNMAIRFMGMEALKSMNHDYVDVELLRHLGVTHIFHVTDPLPFPTERSHPFRGFTLSQISGASRLWLEDDTGKIEAVQENRHFEPGRVEFQVDIPREGLLYTDITFTSGWQCNVNGSGADLEMSPWGTLSIPVRPGAIQAEFTYMPPGFRAGMAISVLTGLVLLLMVIWSFLRVYGKQSEGLIEDSPGT